MTTRNEPGDRPRMRTSAGLVALLAALGSCVTTSLDDDAPAEARPVVVSDAGAPAGSDPALVEFYRSILQQIGEAHRARDYERMRSLVDAYLLDVAPDWAAERLAGFRDLSFGLQFEQHAAEEAVLAQVAVPREGAGGDMAVAEGAASAPALPADTIGAPLDFELRLTAPSEGAWRLGASDDRDPVAFRFTISIRERFVDGSSRKVEDAEVVRLDRGVDLSSQPLALPVRFDLGPSACVRRDVELFVELLPGYVERDGARAPVRQTWLAKARVTQWPRGHAALRQDPLAALRRAMERGDRDHFLHVRVAAEFAGEKSLSEVERMLMDWVRLGAPDQATVAMAALKDLDRTASAPKVGDRDAWLSWWESRR